MRAQVLKTPLKLVEFQLHRFRPRRCYPINMQQAESGIAHREAEKTIQAGRPATGADQPPFVPESGARKSNPDTALATPPASCGDAAAGNPGGRRCADGCPLGCREKTNDDRCSKDASGART
jgi:hypothetical protein